MVTSGTLKTIRTSDIQNGNPFHGHPIAYLSNLQRYFLLFSTHHSTTGKKRDFNLKPHLCVTWWTERRSGGTDDVTCLIIKAWSFVVFAGGVCSPESLDILNAVLMYITFHIITGWGIGGLTKEVWQLYVLCLASYIGQTNRDHTECSPRRNNINIVSMTTNTWYGHSTWEGTHTEGSLTLRSLHACTSNVRTIVDSGHVPHG
jgi:hypothetical protein